MIQQFWAKLSERDQWAVLLGGGFLGLFLLYSLMYTPLTNAVKSQRSTLMEQQETLSWMHSVQKHFVTKHKKKSISSNKLLAVINQELNQSDFSSFSFNLQQINTTDIQLNYDTVPATKILIWLWKLNSQYQINISLLSLDKLQKPGLVKASIVLQGSS